MFIRKRHSSLISCDNEKHNKYAEFQSSLNDILWNEETDSEHNSDIENAIIKFYGYVHSDINSFL